jgi:hypothetical protein
MNLHNPELQASNNRVTGMALGADELAEIDRVLSGPGVDAGVFAELRRRFPHLSWTKCDASDLTETPFRSYCGFELHLVDRSDHCLQITADPMRAGGIILATRDLSS